MTEAPVQSGTGGRRAAREKARKAKARRGQAIAAFSSLVILGGLALVVFTSSGWPDVRETFFSSEAFKTSFPDILDGFWLDVKLFLVVEVIVLMLGLLVAVIRTSRSPALFPIRLLAAFYCDFFRGVPVILLVYLVGFGIPALALEGVPTDPIILAGVALSLAYSSYVAEVYRAGIASVHPSQTDAGLATGLTRIQTLRFVVIPQAVRRVRPPLLNDFISLQKDVALVSILGISEAFRIAQVEAASTFNYTPLIAAALLYLAVTFPMARILDHITAKEQINS
ncbi:MAG: amino acid ABC transporter permease [Solirubrobacterales bacterium]|nr:amino acid ABC transporter permease [Solirubrobacterales bacterium]MCB0859205.1 amino acid ABC transporter permease [Solirubrobacterales bacterium]